MSNLVWTAALSVKVDKMDEEHKKLIQLMNTLLELNNSGATKEQLKGAFLKLIDYTKAHFSDEEKYMASIGYSELENHKHIHAHLLATVGTHYEKFLAGDGKVSDAAFQFLNFWLRSHIKGIDTQYGNFAAQNKLKKVG